MDIYKVYVDGQLGIPCKTEEEVEKIVAQFEGFDILIIKENADSSESFIKTK